MITGTGATMAITDASVKKRRKYLVLSERYRLAGQLMLHAKDGRLPTGIVPILASEFSVHTATVWRIWRRALNGLITGRLDLTTNKTKCGRKPVHNVDLLQAKLVAMPPWKRSTVRSAAGCLDIPSSTFQYLVKNKGLAMRHSNASKPVLTDKNKEDRLAFAMKFVPNERSGIVEPLYDRAHIDEKHFVICEDKASYYLVPEEDPIVRRTKHKKHVTKVMFLACVGRPRTNPNTGEVFDGKIGIYPFVHTVEAKRNSKNRPAGTPETKPYNVTRDVSLFFCVTKCFLTFGTNGPRGILMDRTIKANQSLSSRTMPGLMSLPEMRQSWRRESVMVLTSVSKTSRQSVQT